MSCYQQRTKTLDVYAPCCGAKMTVEYDGSYSGWERATDLPARCPNGHSLMGLGATTYDMQDALHEYLDRRARDGVGDISESDLCGYDQDKAER